MHQEKYNISLIHFIDQDCVLPLPVFLVLIGLHVAPGKFCSKLAKYAVSKGFSNEEVTYIRSKKQDGRYYLFLLSFSLYKRGSASEKGQLVEIYFVNSCQLILSILKYSSF